MYEKLMVQYEFKPLSKFETLLSSARRMRSSGTGVYEATKAW